VPAPQFGPVCCIGAEVQAASKSTESSRFIMQFYQKRLHAFNADLGGHK
jgi:hypothetical protein